MNKKIYEKLKDVARRKDTISYSQLASDCNFPYSSIDERNKFHELLVEISRFEVANGKPMLSVLVHHKGDVERKCGKGFFELADELNQRKENEKGNDKKMQYRIIGEVWKEYNK